jgi:hypothetical protein
VREISKQNAAQLREAFQKEKNKEIKQYLNKQLVNNFFIYLINNFITTLLFYFVILDGFSEAKAERIRRGEAGGPGRDRQHWTRPRLGS